SNAPQTITPPLFQGLASENSSQRSYIQHPFKSQVRFGAAPTPSELEILKTEFLNDDEKNPQSFLAGDLLSYLISRAPEGDGKAGSVKIPGQASPFPSFYTELLHQNRGYTNLVNLARVLRFFTSNDFLKAEDGKLAKLAKTPKADEYLKAWKEMGPQKPSGDTGKPGNVTPPPINYPAVVHGKEIGEVVPDTRIADADLSGLVSDMTAEAKAGIYSPNVHRPEEVEKLIKSLSKKNVKNVFLLGDSGTGKTSLMEQLAVAIVEGKAGSLNNHKIFKVNTAVPKWEEAIGKIGQLGTTKKDIIFHFDSGFSFVNPAGEASPGIRQFLTRENSKMVIETTYPLYRQTMDTHKFLDGKFNVMSIEATTPELTMDILKKHLPGFEHKHEVKYLDEANREAIRLCKTYLANSYFPTKALDVIDEAGVMARVDGVKEVSAQHVARAVSKKSGIPIGTLAEDEREKLINLEKKLHERVFSQDEAIKKISNVIRVRRVGLSATEEGPMATFIFVGPTGVGKTETAKALSEWMSGDAANMTRIDMGEYMEPHSVAKLIGSPPGYVGFDAGGQLTEAIAKKPFGVILFDEFEKAHPDVYKALLPLLDEGRMTDGQGKTVDARNCIIILTSNLGAAEIQEMMKDEGVDMDPKAYQNNPKLKQRMDAIVSKELKKIMTPEQLNRIDDVVMFDPLSKEVQVQIVTSNLEKVKGDALKTKGIVVGVEDSAITFLTEKLFAPKSAIHDRQGGRKAKDIIKTFVKTPLANFVIENNIQRGDQIMGNYDMNSDSIEFSIVSRAGDAQSGKGADAPKKKTP
ncbi:MAG: ATP-dependent Clp protease ATP-binding subunit, partial [Cyanobacteria bacterium]|nr:ATP-dependent Clp protease ATP-binding subunit [Cyanobacteriota bacterium]